jgi:Tfp pilus assembly protein PilF
VVPPADQRVLSSRCPARIWRAGCMTFLPGSFRVVEWRMSRAQRRGNLERTEAIVSSAARRRPADCLLRHLWANLLLSQGRLSEAESVIREAIGGCSSNYWTQSVLAEILHRQGRRVEAEQLCRILVEQEPSEGQAWYIRAALASDSGHNDEAMQFVRRAMALRLSAETRSNAVAIAVRNRDKDLAVALAESALKTASKDPGLHALLALLLEETDSTRAAQEWQQANRYRHRLSEQAFRSELDHYRQLVRRLQNGDDNGSNDVFIRVL